MKIIHPNTTGGISAIHPLTSDMTIEDIALKDTPFGVPYLIVDDSAIPTDRIFRNAWEADFSSPDGYGLGPQRYFIQKAQQEIQEGINVEYNIGLIAQMEAELQ